MIVHIFTQVSDYSNEFIHMIIERFNPDHHVIVFRNKARETELLGKFGSKILFLDKRNDFLQQMPILLKSADKLIFHSFPVSRSLFFWYRYRRYMSKAIWSVWGQDAYWFRYCKKSPVNLVYELLRSGLIRRLDKIFCPIRGDFNYIQSHYKTKAVYVSGMYPIPTDFAALKPLRNKEKTTKTINIQVGNSANPTNNTIEVLRFLGQHASNNFRVYCPLSYGNKEYASQVIKFGKSALGDSFVPITNFLTRSEYADFIAAIDVLIMNHQRQQGLGNIFSYLYLGKKVYIRNDNSSFPFFEEHGIKVFDTQELLTERDIKKIVDMDVEISKSNMGNSEVLISMEKIAADWEEILTLNK